VVLIAESLSRAILVEVYGPLLRASTCAEVTQVPSLNSSLNPSASQARAAGAVKSPAFITILDRLAD
jgi:hypothetical protein